LNTSALRTPLRRGFGHGPRQAEFHGGLRLAFGFRAAPCDVARSTRMMRTIGFGHLLLQSRAPVPRSLSDEIASRAHGFFTDSVFAACPGGVASRRTDNQAPSVFTTLKWLWWIAALVFASHPNVEAFYSSALVVNRTSDAPVAPLGCTGLRIPSHRPTHPHDAETASKRDP